MDAFASPSIRGGTPRRPPFLIAETVATALLLGLSLVGGGLGRPSTGLDASWQEMLIHAHAEGLQFGRDLIFTWGPWGFLADGYHLGNLCAVPILAWQVAGQLLIATAIAVLIRPLVLWRRIAFVAVFLAFHWLFLDVATFVLVVLIGISGLMKREATVARLVGWTLILGFLAQLKFTYFVLTAAAVLAAVACWAGRGSPRRAAAVALGYAGAVVAAWMAAGQNPDNLYPYLRRSLEISSGYADAMGFDESWPVFLWGAALAVLCLVFVVTAWRAIADRSLALGACGLFAFSLYVMWKEGFTRADMVPLGGHVFGFFAYVLIMGPVVPGLLFPGRRLHWFDASVPLCLLAVACFDPEYYRLGPRVVWQRYYGNAHVLLRLGDVPEEWRESLEEASVAASLPAVRAAVGKGSVDVYDFTTGAALLNGLRLASRPIFQSYSAYTPSLEGWNLRFYQSDRAPDFLLWNDEGIDNRYPGQDDAFLLAALPGHYQPLFSERGYWLFRKLTPVSMTPPAMLPVLRQTVRLSEEVSLPPQADMAVWLRARAVPNNLGRMRALLYKPARIDIATTDVLGRTNVWRLLPRVAEGGFLLAPTIAGGGDMAALMTGQSGTWIKSFHFEAPGGQEEFWSHVDVQLDRLPGLPIHSQLPMEWLVALGIIDRPAISATSQEQQQILNLPERALLLHAEGEMVFEIPPGATRFSGGYGIRREAYTGDGHTKGVEFDVEVVWPSGRREPLLKRFLDPGARAGDRGTQRLDLALPEASAARLILRTEPGPDGDNRWDWSYVSGLRFEVPALQ
ncbi:MAG TPA: hypothetical protein VII09_00915 [Opitutaceae bacterium]